ncbi:hypothetical protein Vafri_13251 [Volvox africanus]|uniref:PHD-type domain-containing protein n=1 Tax=Volvox africanus TaxID=51714 RepID=A0A8J4BAV4_9CHLO|nr:hypothetical protein Vafri_13251 [Volvox africanus]
MKPEHERLERQGELLSSSIISEPWFNRDPDAPEYLEVSHNKIKLHLSEDIQPGGSMTVYVQPPGKDVGGTDCGPRKTKYELMKKRGKSGELLGRVDLAKVKNYMLTSRKCKAEVLSGDTVQLWPTSKHDHFVMGLIKEVCWVCDKETGIATNGLAYICEGCNKSVHAKCAGLRKALPEDVDFFCRRCRPTVAEDVIGEEDDDEAAPGQPEPVWTAKDSNTGMNSKADKVEKAVKKGGAKAAGPFPAEEAQGKGKGDNAANMEREEDTADAKPLGKAKGKAKDGTNAKEGSYAMEGTGKRTAVKGYDGGNVAGETAKRHKKAHGKSKEDASAAGLRTVK